MKKNKTSHHSSQEEILPLEAFRKIAHNELLSLLQKASIEIIQQFIQLEVEELCGKVFSHKKNDLCHRGGSENGSIYIQGQKVPLRKPRVRKGNEELPLKSYKNLRKMDNISDRILNVLSAGVSSRKYEEVIEKLSEDAGLSKSSVSRQFILESRKKLDEFKNRKFENHKFFAVFIDGTNVGGQSIVTALGVDIEGNKHFLGFSEGSTENYEITKELLVSFRERGLKFTDKVIFILDGSGSLKKAIKEQFGDSAVIQRCTNHKLWNLLAKLPEKHHEECKLRYRRIFSCNEYSDAKEEYLGFETWLSRISYSASNSLKEAEYDLLTIHKIRMPVEMRKTFLTTNTIESGFSGPKSLMKRVKKWNLGTDMISRWVSVNLLYQEKRFRKINGVNKINIFLADFLEQQLDKKVAA